MNQTHTENRPHLMEAPQLAALIGKIGSMIFKDNQGKAQEQLILIGIQHNGVPLAERLAGELFKLSGIRYSVGTLDISMYRDDIGMRKTLPKIYETDIPFDINGKTIILVDDILQSGRSIRAALDAINYFGRPAVVRLAVLFDRGMREFPIQGDYVGQEYELAPEQRIRINWKEYSNEEDYVFTFNKTTEKV